MSRVVRAEWSRATTSHPPMRTYEWLFESSLAHSQRPCWIGRTSARAFHSLDVVHHSVMRREFCLPARLHRTADQLRSRVDVSRLETQRSIQSDRRRTVVSPTGDR